jgi:hypothetical protein
VAVRWIGGGEGADRRLCGYAVALALGLAAASAGLRTSGWAYPACDGFTAELWRAAQLAALAPLAMAALGFSIAAPRGRLLVALAVGGIGLAGALLVSPGCLQPYGKVDPLLERLWLANVAEAQPLLSAPAWHAIGYAGLLLAGLGASLWMCRRAPTAGWPILAAFQLASLGVTLLQLRGAYAGAMLAAPALAALIAVARARGALPLALAWIASAGFVYPLIGDALMPAREGGPASDCTSPRALAALAALPPGRLLAPTDLSAFALAATPHEVIAGPYHRNSAGNLAMYRTFLAPAQAAERAVRRTGATHVAICTDSFSELDPAAATLAAALRSGNPPAWLERVSRPGESPMIFALSPPPAAH